MTYEFYNLQVNEVKRKHMIGLKYIFKDKIVF